MNEMDDKTVERIAASMAPKIVEHIQASHHEFWIEPEKHYLAHKEWERAQGIWATGQRIFWTAFVGLVVVGAIALAVIGVVSWPDVKAIKVSAIQAGLHNHG